MPQEFPLTAIEWGSENGDEDVKINSGHIVDGPGLSATGARPLCFGWELVPTTGLFVIAIVYPPLGRAASWTRIHDGRY